jgi:V-type H+-transporting ATPase subunit a
MNCLRSVDNGNIKYGFVWSRVKSHDITRELDNKGHVLPELQFQDVASHDFETPTYFKLNAFTEQFQVIVDTYGVPNYKEVNPAVFTIITFPFLFGVMFGDIGHGSLLLIVASLICLFGEGNPALKSVYGTRYLLLMMGFFSLFCGFMYNDFMSIPLDIAGTCYKDVGGVATLKPDCVYPIGIDPKWYAAKNELTFINSLKMKTAVIFGVAQMLLGIFLKSLNAIYKYDFIEYLFEFWPQMILMC